MNWGDPVALRAYNAKRMRRKRMASHTRTPLAAKVMTNEAERHKTHIKKLHEGNAAWRRTL